MWGTELRVLPLRRLVRPTSGQLVVNPTEGVAGVTAVRGNLPAGSRRSQLLARPTVQ